MLTPAHEAFLAELRRHWPMLLAATACGVLVSVSEIVGIAAIVPLLSSDTANPLQAVPVIGALIGQVLQLPKDQLVLWVGLLFGMVALLRGGLSILFSCLIEYARADHERALRLQMLAQVVEVQPYYLEQQKVGNLAALMVNHTAVSGSMLDRLVRLMVSALSLLLLLAMMLAISVWLTLAAMALLSLTSLAIKAVFAPRLEGLAEKATEAVSECNQRLIEVVSGIRSVHFLGVQASMASRSAEWIERYTHFHRRRMIAQGVMSPVFLTGIGVAVSLLLVLAGSVGGERGDIAIASVLTLVILLSRLNGPIVSAMETATYYATNWFQVEELFQFLQRTDKPYLANGKVTTPPDPSDIRFEGVSYHYPGEAGKGVDAIDLTIKAGSVLALVGPSGSGKSTLVGLLARLVDPDRGRIVYDNRDIRDWTLSTWRSEIAVVAQDSFFINASIAENLRLVSARVNDQELWAAVEQAGAAEFIRRLPAQLDTPMEDRGMNLSGGQRQRIGIARALLSGRRIIVLDEATSQLDKEAEAAIQQAIIRLRGRYTIVIVAHRPTTVAVADVVAVIENGRIAAYGTRDELERTSPLYQRLFEGQARDAPAHATQTQGIPGQ